MEIKTDKRIDMIYTRARANCYRGYANKCKEVFRCSQMERNTMSTYGEKKRSM